MPKGKSKTMQTQKDKDSYHGMNGALTSLNVLYPIQKLNLNLNTQKQKKKNEAIITNKIYKIPESFALSLER
jgi:DNA/RNA endonuclease YhcR with UshA esterase domain